MTMITRTNFHQLSKNAHFKTHETERSAVELVREVRRQLRCRLLATQAMWADDMAWSPGVLLFLGSRPV